MSKDPVDLFTLVERVRRGETAALARLYESEAPHLLALALRHTLDRQAAEATVHEVFCGLWRKPHAVGRDVRDYLVQSTLRRVRPPRKRRVVMLETWPARPAGQ